MVAYVYPRRLTRREYSGARGLPSLCLCLWRAPHTHGCPATVAASTAAARSPHDCCFVVGARRGRPCQALGQLVLSALPGAPRR